MARGNRNASSVPQQFLPRVPVLASLEFLSYLPSSSCLGFPQGWLETWKHKSDKSFPSQLAFSWRVLSQRQTSNERVSDVDVRRASLATPGVVSLSHVPFRRSLWLKCPHTPCLVFFWLQVLASPGTTPRPFSSFRVTTSIFIPEKRDSFPYVFLPRKKRARRETHLYSSHPPRMVLGPE